MENENERRYLEIINILRLIIDREQKYFLGA